MESSSSASSAANPPQQGEKRKRSIEHPVPAQPLTPGDMRQRIVEILAGTANGCLQELGYYPGMPARLQELELRNKTWQSENVKLYEDNKRLLEVVKTQNENLKWLKTPDGEKVKRITDLESENRKLRAQLDQLMKINTVAEGAQTAVQDQKYMQLYKEYLGLSETYNRAFHEIVQLREILRTTQKPNHHHHHQQQQDQNAYHVQQQQLQSAPNARRVAPPPVPHIQTQTQPQPGMVRYIQGQMFDSSPVAVSPITQQLGGPQPLRRNELMQTQQAVNQHRQQPGSSAHPDSRRSSGSLIASGPSAQPQPRHPQYQQILPRLATTPTGTLHHQRQAGSSMQQYPRPYQDPLVEMANNVRNERRSSNSTTQTFQPIPLRGSSQSSTSPATRTGSAPLPAKRHTPPLNQHANVELPPTPLSASSVFAPPPFSSSTKNYPSRSVLPTPPTTAEYPAQPAIVIPTTVSPNDTYLNPRSTMQVPSKVVPSPTPSGFPYAPHPTHTVQEGETPKTPTPVPYRSGNDASSSSSASPAPHPRPTPLKRESVSLSDGLGEWTEESNKKPRLEEPASGQNTPGPSSTFPSLSPSPADVKPPPAEAASQVQVEMQVDSGVPGSQEGEQEEHEEDEVIEVGPDGLRLVEDILEQIYGEDRRGEVTCYFCKYRFEHGFTDEPPVPFVGATDEQLEAHCVNDHSIAWNEARADV
ncbi:hypothetical protein BDZ97DRAFT_2072501 [Flammula alnicola]|nr:hypothetical protein BDZ97DRAFT_2072501 [Flammula alnicola]